MHQIKPCPKCGSFDGWSEKIVQSYEQYYDQDGKATHAVDSEGRSRGGKVKYCYNCTADITPYIGE